MRPATDRRAFLAHGVAAGAALLLAARARAQTPDSLPGAGAEGRLGDPDAAGRAQPRTSSRDNDAAVQTIEKRLRCTCGCTLDVYTCRTTDFSCTYSPALHREVLALQDRGLTGQQIVDAFVAKYGEQALMAPKPRGFNLAGYLLPGSLVVAAGAAMLWVLGRRRSLAAAMPAPATPAAVGATPAELEALRRALAETDE